MFPVRFFYNNYDLLTLPVDLSTSLFKYNSVGAQETPLGGVGGKIGRLILGNISSNELSA